MSNEFSYGKALEETEKVTRASTRDARSVTQMTTDELNTEHATVNNATRAQQIRQELNKRNGVK